MLQNFNNKITLNNGTPLTLTNPGGQTTFPLSFYSADTNSCKTAANGNEIPKYVVSIFRSDVGSTTCNGSAGAYNVNRCYGSRIASTTWNLSCTASSTTCTGQSDLDVRYDCTFPLWYVADPTDGVASNTLYFASTWKAAVSAIDDGNATSTFIPGTTGQDVNSLQAYTLNSASIPYASLQPGQRTDPLVATTSMSATGNVGLNQRLTGKAMCTNFTNAVACRNSATSTIADRNQVFATSSVTYGFATTTLGNTLSSTSQKVLKVRIKKSTTTSTYGNAKTYWGISIPSTITLSGTYTGQNTFYALTAAPTDW